jgi:hypothetical protein
MVFSKIVGQNSLFLVKNGFFFDKWKNEIFKNKGNFLPQIG